MKKVGDAPSPSSIYSRLASLERNGLIKCVRKKNGRAYSLTGQGKKTADNIPEVISEVKQTIDKLLFNHMHT
jgi:DNA-binding PadR family transcriptional regulator